MRVRGAGARLSARDERGRRLEALHESVRGDASRYLADHSDAIERYRAAITAGLKDALGALRDDVAALTDHDPTSVALAAQAAEYADAMQWTLWDLPVFAAALAPDPERFRRLAAGCGLVYLSFRVLDDLLDRHYLYRGTRETLLSSFTSSDGRGRDAEGLTVLGAFLLCVEGLQRLAAETEASPAALAPLRRAMEAARRTLVGAVFERRVADAWSRGAYERLVGLKNVDYWRVLNAALDPEEVSPLHPFLREAYALAQRLNDVQDHAQDEARGQPNLVSILRAEEPHGTQDALRERIGDDLLRLGGRLETLPWPERGAAAHTLAGSLAEAQRLGLFGGADAPPTDDMPAPSYLRWDSTVDEFLERLGPDALEDARCAVCDGEPGAVLFRKQGFALRRCACGHSFVSPRVAGGVRARLEDERDGLQEDPFLDVQRIQAEFLCRLLRRFARGPRLLDVGFGRGYLLHIAQAYGFEAYGLDSSATLHRRLQAVFARRLAHARADAGPLPWGSFDVVSMSHVLEHVADPRAVLGAVHDALNSDGLLYVAVPDLGSAQFRVLGKHWNVISPVVHVQYFEERPLRALLAGAGFEVLSRVEQPPEPADFATRATRLFRELGGSESGELALLCRRGADA